MPSCPRYAWPLMPKTERNSISGSQTAKAASTSPRLIASAKPRTASSLAVPTPCSIPAWADAAGGRAGRTRQAIHRLTRLMTVLIDDRPGVGEDRAHFVAVADDGEARVIISRQADGWTAERVE